MSVINYIGVIAILYAIYSFEQSSKAMKRENEEQQRINEFKKRNPTCVKCGSSRVGCYKKRDSWDHFKDVVFICFECGEEYKMDDYRAR